MSGDTPPEVMTGTLRRKTDRRAREAPIGVCA